MRSPTISGMRVTRELFEPTTGGARLVVDTDRLQLILEVGDPAADVDETFSSLDALVAAYRERVAPWLSGRAYIDTGDWSRFAPPDDLKAWLAELEACDTAPDPVGDTALDTAVLRLAALLRRKLNEGLGPEPLHLEDVVFYLGDYGLEGVYLNPPLLAGVDDDALGAFFEKHRFGGWLGRSFRKTPYSFEDNPLDEAFAAYGDPGNLYDPVVGDALTLACAHLEAAPALRANVEVSERLRVFFVFHDEEGDISVEERRLARAHVGGPSAAWFDARRSSAP